MSGSPLGRGWGHSRDRALGSGQGADRVGCEPAPGWAGTGGDLWKMGGKQMGKTSEAPKMLKCGGWKNRICVFLSVRSTEGGGIGGQGANESGRLGVIRWPDE